MSNNVNTRESYIEIGTSFDSNYNLLNSLKLPVPHSLPFTSEFLVDAGRNSEGTMILQQIGRTQSTEKITWDRIDNRKFWQINRWFDDNGYVFYIKFFNHSVGKIQLVRFYRSGSISGEPSPLQQVVDGVSVPLHYTNVTMSLIDMGEDEVITVKEMPI